MSAYARRHGGRDQGVHGRIDEVRRGGRALRAGEGAGASLPLRLLVLTDLVPRDPYNAGASAPEGVVRVDPARFDDLFTRIRPRIAIEVPSVLAEGRPTRVDLSPTSLKSFRPDGLLAEAPLLRSLLDGRMVLERLRDGQVSPDQAEQELSRLWNGSPFVREVLGLLPLGPRPQAAAAPAAASPAPSNGDGAASVDSILAMVDLTAAPSADTAPARAPSRPRRPSSRPPASSRSSSRRWRARAGRAEACVRTRRSPASRRPSGRKSAPSCSTPRSAGWSRPSAGCASSRSGRRATPASASTSSTPPRRDAAGPAPRRPRQHLDRAAGHVRRRRPRRRRHGPLAPPAGGGRRGGGGLQRARDPQRLGQAPRRRRSGGGGGARQQGRALHPPQQAPWRATAAKPTLRWVAIACNGVLSRAPYDKTTSRVREAAVKELPMTPAPGCGWSLPTPWPR